MWSNEPIFAYNVNYSNIPSGYVRFSITSVCNMNCDYCHNEGNHSIDELSIDNILLIVDKIMKYGVRRIGLAGGEPLMHKDIEEICHNIKNKYPHITLRINTNGVEIDTLLRLITLGYIEKVTFGVDYFDEQIPLVYHQRKY